MYDVIIIGAGVGGVAAAVTAAENKLNTLVIGKLMLNSADGKLFDLKKLFENFHLLIKNHKLELKETEFINLEKNIVSFSLEIKSGALYYGKAILIAVDNRMVEFDKITQKTSEGIIKVDSNQKTSAPGVWAVGISTWQENFSQESAVGEAIKAVESILNYKRKG